MTKVKTEKQKKGKAVNVLNVTYVLDMSGSMGAVLDATREGTNGYLRDLLTEEEKLIAKHKGGVFTRLSLTCFDTRVERWTVDQPISEVNITDLVNRYQPRGYTALYDAIAQTIVDMDGRMKDEEREHEKVLVVVMTDGMENASREYARQHGGRERILALIKSYEAKGNWTFVFLGTEDALAEAEAMGIAPGNTASYAATPAAVAGVTRSLAGVTQTRRSSMRGQTVSAFADAGEAQDYITDKPRAVKVDKDSTS